MAGVGTHPHTCFGAHRAPAVLLVLFSWDQNGTDSSPRGLLAQRGNKAPPCFPARHCSFLWS